MLKKSLTIAAGSALMLLAIAETSLAVTFQVIADNLDSPRGLTFGPDGALYVTEAGRGGTGPCIPAPGGGTDVVCYGATGAITRIQNNTVQRITTGLPSIALPFEPLNITIDATGIHDLQFDSSGKAYAIFGLGSSPEQRDQVLNISEFGQLVALDNLNSQVSLTPLADLAEYEALFNPDDIGSGFFNPYNNGIDSNPYAFLIQGDTAYIVDAAGNDFFAAKLDGSELNLLSILPERTVIDPLTGNTIALQSVPTSVTIGPDGAFYIAEFTGFPYPENQARIFRIDSNNQVEIYAEGFTQIIDLAFDAQGGLYVLEFASKSLFSEFSLGDLIYIDPNGNRTSILSDVLNTPTALEIAPNGDIYISNQGYVPGQGQVLRVSVNEAPSTPESTPLWGLLSIGILGSISQLLPLKKKKRNLKYLDIIILK
ncbi:ScyD/ScyE family protein [Aphanothece sacrum]|uniref:NHL repeat containing protein n=1 Tax=Aphanothece sacrum FPU1 TaxID=1920663 RepID=A0A401IH78_APHSA|nr:ScyD/ScyE family protein [Aphanothece sacrum]GBF80655.1 hypothetical protein AsFPU1_2059 [Aphanothece sacrum FPU1]GBF83149.1 hypothetical protein AsFPU3_0188 [Aphanothece sacrum FPU3]